MCKTDLQNVNMALRGGSRSAADGRINDDFEAYRANADTELILNGHADHLDTSFEPTFMRSRPRLVLETDDINNVTSNNTGPNPPSIASATSNYSPSDFELGYRCHSVGSTLPSHHCHTEIVRTTTAARNQLIVVAILSLLFMTAEIIGK